MSKILAVITPSYRNDLELVQDLASSLDKFMTMPFEHIIIVPKRDLRMFEPLRSGNRRIICAETILRPFGFFKLPIPTEIKIPGIIYRRIRERWYHPRAGIISGWVIQQLLKLSATRYTDAETFMFIDSDVVLFRQLSEDHIFDDGMLKLSRRKIAPTLKNHFIWHSNAIKLLGSLREQQVAYDYIGNLIVWDREILLMLEKKIGKDLKTNWLVSIAMLKAISEYILYGVFVESLGRDQRHCFHEDSITCSFWTKDLKLDLEAMTQSIRPEHLALHIQSTVPLKLEMRRALIDGLIDHSNNLAALDAV